MCARSTPSAGELLDEVRSQGAPRALILHTCRFGPHSKGDDTRPADDGRSACARSATRSASRQRGWIEKL